MELIDQMEIAAEEGQQQYSARAQVPDFEQIIAGWARNAEVSRATARAEYNIPYGDHPAARMDIFYPDDPPSAVILFVRGGYWRSLDKSIFSTFAAPLAAKGAIVAIPNYSHCPNVTLDDIVREIRQAATFVYRKFCDRPQGALPLAVAGHSAGGHLAAMLLTTDWPALAPDLPVRMIAGAALVSGLYDLRPLVRLEFINKDIRLDAASAVRCSPALHACASDIPIVLAVGGNESDSFRWQARRLAESWAGQVAEHHVLQGFNHLETYEAMCDPDTPIHRAILSLAGLDTSNGQ